MQLQKRRREASEVLVSKWNVQSTYQAFDKLRTYSFVCQLREIAGKLKQKRNKIFLNETKAALFRGKLGPQLDTLSNLVEKLISQSTREAFTVLKHQGGVEQEGDPFFFLLKTDYIFNLKLQKTGFMAIKEVSLAKQLRSKPSFKKLSVLEKLQKHAKLRKGIKSLFFYPFMKKSFCEIRKQSSFAKAKEGLDLLKDAFRVAARRRLISALKKSDMTERIRLRQLENQPVSLKVASTGTSSTHVSDRFVQYVKPK